MADRADPTVRLVAGDGLIARRSSELVFSPSADPAIVAAFDGAPPGQAIDAVTALVEAGAETGEIAGDFVVVQWTDRLRVAVFGAVEVTSDHRSLPRLSASGAGTWIERSIAADEPIVLRCGVGAVLATTSLVAGTVSTGGFELRVEPSPAGASPAPSTPAPPPDVDAIVSDPEMPEHGMPDPEMPGPVAADPAGPVGDPRWLTNAFAALSESDDGTIDPGTIDPGTTDPGTIDPGTIAGGPVEAASQHVAPTTGRTGPMNACPSCLAPVRMGAAVCTVCGYQFVTSDDRAGDDRAGDDRGDDHRIAVWQIVFADGRVEPVDRTLVLGRDPHPDDAAARPVALDCDLVSATHLEVRAVGAELHLVDLGSRNNTFVLTTGDAQFVPIEPGRPHRVGDGAVVQLGSRRFTVVRIEAGADGGSNGTSLGNAPQ